MDLIDLFQYHPGSFTAVVFLFALAIGSFLNVVIHRLPIMMEREWRVHCAEIQNEPPPKELSQPFNLVVPGSRCPSCSARIRPWHNIPLISYLVLRGRCADCGSKIPLRYPAVELATAVLSAVVAWRLGFGWPALFALLLTWSLIALSGVDIDRHLLPDAITVPLVWVGLFLSLFHAEIESSTLFVTPRDSIIGALAGYLSLWSVYWLFKLITGKEGMGHGDFKLLAALGAWLGWQALPLVVVLSAAVGALIGIALILFRGRDRGTPIPFGPYLAAAGWIALLWGPDIVDTYKRVSGLA